MAAVIACTTGTVAVLRTADGGELHVPVEAWDDKNGALIADPAGALVPVAGHKEFVRLAVPSYALALPVPVGRLTRSDPRPPRGVRR